MIVISPCSARSNEPCVIIDTVFFLFYFTSPSVSREVNNLLSRRCARHSVKSRCVYFSGGNITSFHGKLFERALFHEKLVYRYTVKEIKRYTENLLSVKQHSVYNSASRVNSNKCTREFDKELLFCC